METKITAAIVDDEQGNRENLLRMLGTYCPQIKISAICSSVTEARTVLPEAKPDILFLDEPTSGLDPLMQNRFVELVEEEKNKGKTIFLSSHIFEEVEKTCDRVGILRGGKLIRDITIDELRSSQMTTYQIGFSDVSDLRRFQRQYPDAHCAKNALQLTISIPDSQINPLIGALSQCSLRFLREEKHTLEEYFMQFYGGEEHV